MYSINSKVSLRSKFSTSEISVNKNTSLLLDKSNNKAYNREAKVMEVSKKKVKALSATGSNPAIPKMTIKAQKRHGKHLRPGRSFAGMTVSEYAQKGMEFARLPTGGSIVGYRGEDGCIVRFNKVTGEWVKAYTTGVATYMKPSAGKAYYDKWFDLDKGVISDD